MMLSQKRQKPDLGGILGLEEFSSLAGSSFILLYLFSMMDNSVPQAKCNIIPQPQTSSDHCATPTVVLLPPELLMYVKMFVCERFSLALCLLQFLQTVELFYFFFFLCAIGYQFCYWTSILPHEFYIQSWKLLNLVFSHRGLNSCSLSHQINILHPWG